MSANPPLPTSVPWYRSQRFIAVCQITALYVLTWLGQAITTRVWDFYSLGGGVISALLVILKDWWSPTVAAPLSFMNKGNP